MLFMETLKQIRYIFERERKRFLKQSLQESPFIHGDLNA